MPDMSHPTTPAQVEALSAELHAIYQQEARRQAGTGEDAVRHPDDYSALPEHTKEYDRVLARFILQREATLRESVAQAQRKADAKLAEEFDAFHTDTDGIADSCATGQQIAQALRTAPLVTEGTE